MSYPAIHVKDIHLFASTTSTRPRWPFYQCSSKQLLCSRKITTICVHSFFFASFLLNISRHLIAYESLILKYLQKLHFYFTAPDKKNYKLLHIVNTKSCNKPVCRLWCRFSWSERENLRSQSLKSHWYGFSPWRKQVSFERGEEW